MHDNVLGVANRKELAIVLRRYVFETEWRLLVPLARRDAAHILLEHQITSQ